MLFAARRLVARAPAALRVAPTPVNSASRLFTSSALRFAAGPPVIQGEGAKDGEMPTDEQQATGLERFELLGKLQGVEVFDMEPLQMTHLGTTEKPIKVKSYWPTRIVGCTGYPADSHDTIYLHLNNQLKHHRCPECGSVYEMDFEGDAHAGHH
ncbi:probable COX4-cytochrome-c oxidase chain IV [Sporisorium reilianum SRZ2]|uniref:Cytochrome c oxidase subunit 4, mitochondrial n=2 Tax=Sporisorium reilianum TaxID=72558 RepID=E6ZRA0_SPORE|nr:probable COX4-cytochrome-c oxidase chain IV [Sporisorium reilianum SRZ2]SJX65405.1 probable COX4-cytochrome-c oxidase chain IV [Sporisorium reilianum f. sp. reilianum]